MAGTGKKRVPEDGGVISTDAIYTRAALRRILGIGEPAIRAAKKNGLKERPLFGKLVIHGRDIAAYLDSQS